ncbi:MFS transporter [Parasulfitobacter algicola]|uniref:MFS transporter n=1 Tax=Parasulfitobacter algicola TaxID=2614809 RepID=A0ABX2ISE5_9RHOB|nr:MFS transporter [Sulfitobacter algicola]NSX53211.1 MFS transporter [Sulfitobacter algicola]
MQEISLRKRIWGWMAFDWASQPYYTLGLTFIFGPYFAGVAADYFIASGMPEQDADARTQSLWSFSQMIAGLIIAFTAPVLGAFADASGRKIPWIAFFSIIYVGAAWSLWWLYPDGRGIWLTLILFYVGFIAAESALNFVNAILPSLGNDDEVGRLSGSGLAVGYWGGVVGLFIMLLFFAENEQGKTLIGLNPAFGLDPEAREGTRFIGPFIAMWYALFIIPFFMWVRDEKLPFQPKIPAKKVMTDLWATIKSVFKRKSLGNFLLSSMLYRDALNAMYTFGGVYARLVLEWSLIMIGVFGIIGALTAAIAAYVGGFFDRKYGPKPVIRVCIYVLIAVGIMIVGMSRTYIFGIPLPEGSILPDIIFFLCGAGIGGAGGALYASSRSMMVRHTNPDRPTEAFGLFALSGKATAFLAPALIALFTWGLNNNQLGFIPVIFLFILGLILLRWVNSDGDKAEWSASSASSSR